MKVIQEYQAFFMTSVNAYISAINKAVIRQEESGDVVRLPPAEPIGKMLSEFEELLDSYPNPKLSVLTARAMEQSRQTLENIYILCNAKKLLAWRERRRLKKCLKKLAKIINV